jgi:predicted phage terminase large subunit-like protein
MIDQETIDLRARLAGSLLLFIKFFYKTRTGRDFIISNPPGRQSHFIDIAKALTRVLDGQTKRLIINVPPRYGKTEMLIHFVTWAIAQYPDSNFIYTSYSKTLAERQTQTIRDIINLPTYKKIFDVYLDSDSTAKDNFKTNKGGNIYAAGAGGTITGFGCGIKSCTERFSGALLIDDIHKPDEVTSDTIRERINDWYYNTAQSRLNCGDDTPIIFIGQRLHEDDLPSNLIATGEWETLIIPALDAHNNALHPEMHSVQDLLKMKENQPYVFASQYQQDPQPAGGAVYKREWFPLLDQEPKILTTFITADTAETHKNYNDPTVFSFWGVYKIMQKEIETDIFGLQWIDCREIWIEPKDLESEFLQFYSACMRYHVKPSLAAIEKKSTGVTLVSILSNMQGLQVIDIDRTKASGNKAARFLEIQPYVASKRVSLLRHAKHSMQCIAHCAKITANNTHRHDDIADTLYDAVKMALIDEVIIKRNISTQDNHTNQILKKAMSKYNSIESMKRNRSW